MWKLRSTQGVGAGEKTNCKGYRGPINPVFGDVYYYVYFYFNAQNQGHRTRFGVPSVMAVMGRE